MKYLLCLLFLVLQQPVNFRLPINASSLSLTPIGGFGLERKARLGIPAHLHSGIDIKPPNDNYQSNELIYPIAKGIVISKRTDGPFAQLILEHDLGGEIIWTVYEHIAEVRVNLYQPVETNTPLARFFLVDELDKIGWQFNHFHFEILRKRPIELKPSTNNPERLFNSFTLSCHSHEELVDHFYDPMVFLSDKVKF